MGVEPVALIVRDAADVERAITAFAYKPDGGLILPPDSVTIRHRELIVDLAAGGLVFYGADFADIFRSAATYVDRVLRGERPTIGT